MQAMNCPNSKENVDRQRSHCPIWGCCPTEAIGHIQS